MNWMYTCVPVGFVMKLIASPSLDPSTFFTATFTLYSAEGMRLWKVNWLWVPSRVTTSDWSPLLLIRVSFISSGASSAVLLVWLIKIVASKGVDSVRDNPGTAGGTV